MGGIRVAIFTDNDFGKVNGVTTTLKAVLQFSERVEPRVYTAADLGVTTANYFATPSFGIGLPWYREMRIYWPRLAAFSNALERDGVDVIHVTTPGPVGLAGRWLAARHRSAARRQLPHASRRLRVDIERVRAVGRRAGALHALVLPAVRSAARAVNGRARSAREPRLRVQPAAGLEPRGRHHAVPSRSRLAAWRRAWHVDVRRPAILYAGRLSREKGLHLVGPLQQQLHRRGLAHQFVFAGDGPMRAELEAMCPDGVFLGALPHDRVAVAMASSRSLPVSEHHRHVGQRRARSAGVGSARRGLRCRRTDAADDSRRHGVREPGRRRNGVRRERREAPAARRLPRGDGPAGARIRRDAGLAELARSARGRLAGRQLRGHG